MRNIEYESPDFVNVNGVQWWHEPELSRYAEKKGLSEWRVWTVRKPNGYMTRLILKDQKIVAENQTLEGLGVLIDIVAAAHRFNS